MKESMLAMFLLATGVSAQAAGPVPPAPNGIAFPEGYRDWRVISTSHRLDNHTLRVILGNDIAVAAARAGNTNPWPDGAILAKLVWKEAPEAHWPQAIAPEAFVHAEFMLKDSRRFADNGTGWGWARWTGLELKPWGEDAKAAQACIACHTPVRGRDWVFTTPAPLPPR